MKDVAEDLALIVRNAIAYIKNLEQQINELKREPVQDPVAWIDKSGHPKHIRHLQSVTERRLYGPLRPLYTAPPQRKPLTEEELDELAMDKDGLPNSHIEFARAIERAHGIGGSNE